MKTYIYHIACNDQAILEKFIKTIPIRDELLNKLSSGICIVDRIDYTGNFQEFSKTHPNLTLKIHLEVHGEEYGISKEMEIKHGQVTELWIKPAYRYHYYNAGETNKEQSDPTEGFYALTKRGVDKIIANDRLVISENGNLKVEYKDREFTVENNDDYEMLLYKEVNHIHVYWEKKAATFKCNAD